MGIDNQKESGSYIYLDKSKLESYFELKEDKLFLKSSKAKPIKLRLPFKFDEDIARIAGMILDGSLDKNFSGVMFSQKKDKNKVQEFSNIAIKLFDVLPIFTEKNGTYMINFCSKTLSVFFNKCLDIHRSDEGARIPYWIWKSPKSVIIEYLRYAFAMEGSIDCHLKGSEIKFHSVRLPHLLELSILLKDKFGINSSIQNYYVEDYGWKYYLWFCKKEEVIKFQEIGFALESHQKRLIEIINSFKNKAWEITLVSVFKLNKETFTKLDINKLFPYLLKDAIRYRLDDLVKMGLVKKEKQNYYLTDNGCKIAASLQNKIKEDRLRTNPRENEEKILEFLQFKEKSYRNEIARELKINPLTVRDVLRRLIKKNKVKFTEKDKFQRRFYSLKKNGCGITHSP